VDAKYGPTRPGDVKDSIADITKARRLLGYEPTVSLEQGLKSTIDWYRSAN
jgi:nucleoside-diphosphate-sugar epimerase